MADITYTNDATERRASPGIVPGKGDAHSLKVLVCATIELTAATQNDTIQFGRIPSTARILPIGLIANDDLETANSPTLDVGLGSVDSNITSDPVALIAGIDLAAATSTTTVLSDVANAGLPAWSLVSGQTSDPGGELDIYGSVVDAATDTTGTITVVIYGYLD